MRLMPGGLRRRAAFKVASAAIERIAGVPPNVEYQKHGAIFHYYNCPYCEGSESDEPICFYDIGILKALAEWDMGRPQKVTEIECAAMGAVRPAYMRSRTCRQAPGSVEEQVAMVERPWMTIFARHGLLWCHPRAAEYH